MDLGVNHRDRHASDPAHGRGMGRENITAAKGIIGNWPLPKTHITKCDLPSGRIASDKAQQQVLSTIATFASIAAADERVRDGRRNRLCSTSRARYCGECPVPRRVDRVSNEPHHTEVAVAVAAVTVPGPRLRISGAGPHVPSS